MIKLPIGIQDFETMRIRGLTYIDKTQYLAPLLTQEQYVFFARPRRFGKSLTLSTLKAALEGKQQLFEGLWLYNNYHFKPKPVVHLLMNHVDAKTGDVGQGLIIQLRKIAQDYGVNIDENSVGTAIQTLVWTLHAKTGQQVNLLIDEYDKLLIDYMDEPEVLASHIKVLRGLYGTFKGLEQYLGLVMLTGVSKFGKLNLFSDLNNIEDISLSKQFARLCGYTREEIEVSFAEEVLAVQEELAIDGSTFWQHTQDWYNGFSWDGIHKLYCPYSFLLFLKNKTYKSYWYEYASPKLVLDAMRKDRINLRELQHIVSGTEVVDVADINNIEFYSLMFQVGNLTIKSIKPALFGLKYQLDFPNKEVRTGFSNDVLRSYGQGAYINSALAMLLAESFVQDDYDTVIEYLNTLFASIPYGLFANTEAYFHTVMHTTFMATSLDTHSETHTSKGRIDMVVGYQNRVWIFEYKLNQSADVALQQIRDKGYAEQFAGKDITLVGVEFSSKKRKLMHWTTERISGSSPD